MAKKRKGRGRKKGQSGSKHRVQCSKCGRLVPADKAKKVTKRVTLVDRDTAYTIRKGGGYVPFKVVTRNLCISCAVHTRQVHIRSKRDRDRERPLPEQKMETKTRYLVLEDAKVQQERRQVESRRRKEKKKRDKRRKEYDAKQTKGGS